MRGALLTMFVLVGVARIAHAQPIATDAEVQAARTAGEEVLRSFAALSDFTELGLRSKEEVTKGKLGQPFIEAVLSDVDLAQRDHERIRRSLGSSGTVVFPVSVDGELRSSLIMHQPRTGTWVPLSFGARKTIKVLVAQRVEDERLHPGVPAQYFAIRIPTLGVELLGIRRDGRDQARLLTDDPRFEDLRREPFDLQTGLNELRDHRIDRILEQPDVAPRDREDLIKLRTEIHPPQNPDEPNVIRPGDGSEVTNPGAPEQVRGDPGRIAPPLNRLPIQR